MQFTLPAWAMEPAENPTPFSMPKQAQGAALPTQPAAQTRAAAPKAVQPSASAPEPERWPRQKPFAQDFYGETPPDKEQLWQDYAQAAAAYIPDDDDDLPIDWTCEESPDETPAMQPAQPAVSTTSGPTERPNAAASASPAGGLGVPPERPLPPDDQETAPMTCTPLDLPGSELQRVASTLETQETARFTDAFGKPVDSDMHSLTVGPEGITALTDVYQIQKLAKFDRERIPERVVHAKGAGAFGEFVAYGNVSDFTMLHFLQQPNQTTPVFVRFSTVIGSRGSADTARDPRGFAVKFYTEEGNFDLVGNNIPVFFIRDSIKFPDVIHSLKPDPVTNLRIPERFWDFISLTPEATHMITWLYSDYGTLASFRYMNGFGVNTFVLVSAAGERRLAKFHWISQQGIRTLTRQEADALAGIDPDVAAKDLYCAIAAGDCPRYELCVQLMDFDIAATLPFDPLDDTKTWDENQFPLVPLGMMTLNRNPENFFSEVEQAAFCPANIVPGIEFSADKMLTGRTFSYSDTQRYRIGANFAQLPVNKPMTPIANFQQDGPMNYDFTRGSVNYYPNSLAGNLPMPDDGLNQPGVAYCGELVRQQITRTDDFFQAGEKYRSYSPVEQARLVDNIAVELTTCRKDIIERVLSYFDAADAQFGAEVRKMLKL